MGKTIEQWRDRVEELLRDANNVDVSTTQIDEAGIRPALGQYSVDRPYEDVSEAAGAGSSHLDLPAGWVDDFSRVAAVEYPARNTPPDYLDDQAFRIVRDPDDVTSKVLLLDGYTPSASQYVRIEYTRPWPFPDADASTDLVDEVAFNAVTALAASFVCTHLAASAARARDGALPTDFVTDERARWLKDLAASWRAVYDSFLGRTTGSGPGGSGSTAPVSRRFDYDPGSLSLFHGGRR